MDRDQLARAPRVRQRLNAERRVQVLEAARLRGYLGEYILIAT